MNHVFIPHIISYSIKPSGILIHHHPCARGSANDVLCGCILENPVPSSTNFALTLAPSFDFRHVPPCGILVDLDVHAGSDPDEVSLSHGGRRGESVSGEPNALGMVACNFLKQIGDGLNGGSAVESDFITANGEILLVREPVRCEATGPQPIR